ncbi:MAG: hypothetical protein U1F49_07905 [Rubrivivax sp.]
MLTTAGAARRAAWLKLFDASAGAPAADDAPAACRGGACVSVGSGSTLLPPLRGSHSGLSVATTNSTASATVTACAKRSQVRRHME